MSETPISEVPVQAADPTPVPPAPVWDPDRDLLPYHPADELGPDEPLGARGWIPWVVGAVVLVAVVLVLLRVFASDPVAEDATDPATSDQSSSSSPDDAGAAGKAEPGEGAADEEDETDETDGEATDSPAPEGTGPRLDLATSATVAVPSTAPPTTDLDGDLVAYEAAQVVDGDPATTWRTAGDATGQTITFTLAEPGVVDRVGIVNGYAKQVAGVDWYPNNRRVLAVTWGFDDGSSVQQTLTEQPGLQRLAVPPVETSTVTLRLDQVTPPGSGTLGRDYTAVSEVVLLGRRAG